MSANSEMRVFFSGGKRVDVAVGDKVIHTDQPIEHGGDDSAPAPYTLFLASIAACAGVYVLGFCQARGLDSRGVGLVQRLTVDPVTRQLQEVAIDIEVPPSFPEQYREALVRVASQCTVKKAIAAQPAFTVRTVAAASTTAPALGGVA